jgi:large subunit ribosomal protein L31
MKTGIHPVYYNGVTVQCICGNVFTINWATVEFIKVEACPACHPAYTGQKQTKVVKGRMEKILEKMKKIEELQNKQAA